MCGSVRVMWLQVTRTHICKHISSGWIIAYDVLMAWRHGDGLALIYAYANAGMHGCDCALMIYVCDGL